MSEGMPESVPEEFLGRSKLTDEWNTELRGRA